MSKKVTIPKFVAFFDTQELLSDDKSFGIEYNLFMLNAQNYLEECELKFYCEDHEKVLDKLQSAKDGLSSAEADSKKGQQKQLKFIAK